jgi:hypothetical protein
MRRIAGLAALVLVASSPIASEAPVTVSVRELLSHPRRYDHRLVDVTGYYLCGMEDSDLWPDAGASRSESLTSSVYIDAATWDSRLHPRRSPAIADPWRVTQHRARVIGVFRAGGVRSKAAIPPDGPTILAVTYFQCAR